MSSILLVLIDVRCPPLHFPPSLQEYISSLQPRKEVILVLTKCDLIPVNVKDAWVRWCKHEWEEKKGWEVVEVESYKRGGSKVSHLATGPLSQTRSWSSHPWP
jgi:ribosome biogenesis GTPase A